MLREMKVGDVFCTDYGCLGVVTAVTYLSMETRTLTDSGEIKSFSSIGVIDDNGDIFSKLNSLPLRMRLVS